MGGRERKKGNREEEGGREGENMSTTLFVET